ncbi:TPA: hypothetical protein N0F65_007955 [Lagenidium giganteum]|uniref:Ubiquitin-like protease family profile domain-containing protein n=1 Tax=Lagenidium giganteum TaxID=4803 RepID=A0AAV2YEV2_9STRA|nr:TPA: hypothetical protein N0F65_007955 [Lagenidium giganteum]
MKSRKKASKNECGWFCDEILTFVVCYGLLWFVVVCFVMNSLCHVVKMRVELDEATFGMLISRVVYAHNESEYMMAKQVLMDKVREASGKCDPRRYVFSKEFSEVCVKHVTKLKEHEGKQAHDEVEAVVEVASVGYVEAAAFAVMIMVHDKRKCIVGVQEALRWIRATEGAVCCDANMVDKMTHRLQKISLFQMVPVHGQLLAPSELLAFRESRWLNDVCIYGMLRKFQSLHRDVYVINPNVLATKDHAEIRRGIVQSCHRLSGTTIVPVNIGSVHWAVVVIDWSGHVIRFFDPTQDRRVYDELKQLVKDHFATFMAPRFPDYTQITDEVLKQQDVFNCGIFVIRYVEAYLQKLEFEHISRADCQLLRLRYLSMLLEDCGKHSV